MQSFQEKEEFNHPQLQLMSPPLLMPTLVGDRGTATTEKHGQRDPLYFQDTRNMSEVLVINRNRELDWLDISYDNWLATRHVHDVGWLLTKWCDDFFSGRFLPPSQFDAVAHSETIPARPGSELCCERGCQETTEFVGLVRVESVEVSVLSMDNLVVPGLENLFRRDQCICFQVGENVRPGATYGLLYAVGAEDGRPCPYRDGRQGM